MNLTYLPVLLLVTVAMAMATLFLARRDRLVRSVLMLLGIMLLTYTSSLPALAAPSLAALGAEDRAIPEQQKEQEEALKLAPGGSQYSGLESAPKTQTGESPSDEEITQKIKSEIRSDLVVNTTNGSVILSGTVEDRETARQLVEQVKELPGVQEVTFELGLQNPAI